MSLEEKISVSTDTLQMKVLDREKAQLISPHYTLQVDGQKCASFSHVILQITLCIHLIGLNVYTLLQEIFGV